MRSTPSAMTPVARSQAVSILADARLRGPTLDALPEACRPSTLDDAHAIQAELAQYIGEDVVGWKVAAMPDGRLARGAILRSRLVQSGVHLAASMTPLLGVECEIAFLFDQSLAPRPRAYTYEEVAAAVTALPGIEIVDSRLRGYPNSPPLDRIADCMSNGAFVIGAPRADWRAFDLSQLDVELALDEEVVVHRLGGHPTKDPLLPAVAFVNDLRTAAGVPAGAIVTTGTYTGLHFATPGQKATATFQRFGTVTVIFETGPVF